MFVMRTDVACTNVGHKYQLKPITRATCDPGLNQRSTDQGPATGSQAALREAVTQLTIMHGHSNSWPDALVAKFRMHAQKPSVMPHGWAVIGSIGRS